MKLFSTNALNSVDVTISLRDGKAEISFPGMTNQFILFDGQTIKFTTAAVGAFPVPILFDAEVVFQELNETETDTPQPHGNAGNESEG